MNLETVIKKVKYTPDELVNKALELNFNLINDWGDFKTCGCLVTFLCVLKNPETALSFKDNDEDGPGMCSLLKLRHEELISLVSGFDLGYSVTYTGFIRYVQYGRLVRNILKERTSNVRG